MDMHKMKKIQNKIIEANWIKQTYNLFLLYSVKYLDTKVYWNSLRNIQSPCAIVQNTKFSL